MSNGDVSLGSDSLRKDNEMHNVNLAALRHSAVLLRRQSTSSMLRSTVRTPMPKFFYKHKVLLDENMPSRRLLKQLNHHFDVKHVRDDLRHGELGDPDVYQLAATQGRIVVTFNGRDFRSLVGAIPNDPGVIDVPMDGQKCRSTRKSWHF